MLASVSSPKGEPGITLAVAFDWTILVIWDSGMFPGIAKEVSRVQHDLIFCRVLIRVVCFGPTLSCGISNIEERAMTLMLMRHAMIYQNEVVYLRYYVRVWAFCGIVLEILSIHRLKQIANTGDG